MCTHSTKTLQILQSLSCGQEGECAILDSSVTHLGPLWAEDKDTQLYVLAENKCQNCVSTTDLRCSQDKRYHCNNPQLLLLLFLDPKLSKKKYSKIFGLDDHRGSNGHMFTPHQVNEKPLKQVWFLFACGRCLSTLMAQGMRVNLSPKRLGSNQT